MTAMVIDDSKAMRIILSGYLSQLGFNVIEAEHGKSALAHLEQNGGQDVVLVDWNMPVMNGLDFVTEVRKNPAYKDVRLLIVTSESELAQVSKALRAGADEYLMKPFTRDSLLQKLRLMGIQPAA